MRIHHAAAAAAVLALLAACEKSEPPDVIVMDVPGATAPVAAPTTAPMIGPEAVPAPGGTPAADAPAAPPAATVAPPAAAPPAKAGATTAPPVKGATPAAAPPAKTAAKTAAAPAAPAPPAEPAADLANGQTQFARCQSCHSVTPGAPSSLGPNLAGIFGNRAASSAGYANYSDALKNSGITWTEANLDRWLTRPLAMVPGNKMIFPGLPDAKNRADLIAWLKTK